MGEENVIFQVQPVDDQSDFYSEDEPIRKRRRTSSMAQKECSVVLERIDKKNTAAERNPTTDCILEIKYEEEEDIERLSEAKVIEEPEDQPELCCSICAKIFETRPQLKRHKR